MKNRYIIDTNVLIAASAGDPVSPTDIDATPSDPTLRIAIWKWLNDFEVSASSIVMDELHVIWDEYYNKISGGDYGMQVIMFKYDKGMCDLVSVTYDCDGIAILPEALTAVVHDISDRKFVAASLASIEKAGDGCIAFAGDSDWHGWERDLNRHGIELEPIIRDWSLRKYHEKLDMK